MSPQPKMGRPKLPRGEAKTETLILRLSADEKHAIEAAAEYEAEGNVSGWVRDVVMRAAASAISRRRD